MERLFKFTRVAAKYLPTVATDSIEAEGRHGLEQTRKIPSSLANFGTLGVI